MLGSTELLLIEDNSARAVRRLSAEHANVVVRVHRLTKERRQVVAERSYRPGTLTGGGRAEFALRLLDKVPVEKRSIVIAGSVYGSNDAFIQGLRSRKLDFIVEVRPSTVFTLCAKNTKARCVTAVHLTRDAQWESINLRVDGVHTPFRYSVARITEVMLPGGCVGHVFAAQTGGILGVHRGTIFGLSSRGQMASRDLLKCVGWVRWIRTATRRVERAAVQTRHIENPGTNGHTLSSSIKVRANIKLARQQDEKNRLAPIFSREEYPRLLGHLEAQRRVLNVVELFSGAGGLGLGFLMATHDRRRYRLLFSGEIKRSFVQTLNLNHATLGSWYPRSSLRVPTKTSAIDLSTESANRLVRRVTTAAGGVDVLIGGPPCQGFSNANRNSWFRTNPNNRLVDVFLRYVEEFRPRVFVMENVQGILWTRKAGRSGAPLRVIDHLARRMQAAGYLVFPKLLDAVWYGVPQHRSRIFVMGIRGDLGYGASDFGEWGPFPRPNHGPGCRANYVTVRDAIADLPRVANGCRDNVRRYRSPDQTELRGNEFLRLMREHAPRRDIFDHVTSRHAAYVIERYRRIPPGGNWEDIADQLTNYAHVGRTHSNIYRRLEWDRPAITIGHYRKSMIVHPSQHRGLSLREAARLQSFPDWFRFSGPLVDQQQQLANAVCPLVAKAIAEFILQL